MTFSNERRAVLNKEFPKSWGTRNVSFERWRRHLNRKGVGKGSVKTIDTAGVNSFEIVMCQSWKAIILAANGRSLQGKHEESPHDLV